MKVLFFLTLTSFLLIGCGKSEQGASGGSTTTSSGSPISGVENVTGSTELSGFKSLVEKGKFSDVKSDHLKAYYESTSYGFNRELKDKQNIIRVSSDLDSGAGSTPSEVRDFLLSIINKAGDKAQMFDPKGTIWVFMVNDNTSYMIDLNIPLAANPVRKVVTSTSSESCALIFTCSSTRIVEGYKYLYTHHLFY